jgi:hypothetical protein
MIIGGTAITIAVVTHLPFEMSTISQWQEIQATKGN